MNQQPTAAPRRRIRKAIVATCGAFLLLLGTAAPAFAVSVEAAYKVVCNYHNGDSVTTETDSEDRAEKAVKDCITNSGVATVS